MINVLAFLVGLTLPLIGFFTTQIDQEPNLGSGGGGSLWYIVSGQLRPVSSTAGIRLPSLTSENCIGTDADGDFQSGTCGGGSSLHTDATTYIYPTGGKYHSAPYYVATSTTASTFPYASSTAITATNFWGTASLATALGANGSNCSAGSAPLGVDASGASEGCFDVWTEAENTAAAYLQNIVEDTTPQLGGALDAQGNNITDLGDVTFKTGATGGTLRTGTSNADKFELQGYDVDGGTYVKVFEVDAGNDVTAELFDESFTLRDTADETKRIEFELGGITTGNTRTLTIPDSSGTLAFTSNILDDFGQTSLADPNADYLVFWDDSDSQFEFISTLTNLSITGNTLAVSDSFLLNNGDTGTGTYDFSGATLKQHTYKSFTWPGTPTTTTATTTVPLGTAYTAEAWNGAECYTTSGTSYLVFTDGTNDMNSRTATTTVGRFTLSSNNTFTASEKRYVEIGALTAAQLSCTVDVTINN